MRRDRFTEKRFAHNIWIEGYSTHNEPALFGGCITTITLDRPATFAEACDEAFRQGRFERWGEYDSESLSVQGCDLFPLIDRMTFDTFGARSTAVVTTAFSLHEETTEALRLAQALRRQMMGKEETKQK